MSKEEKDQITQTGVEYLRQHEKQLGYRDTYIAPAEDWGMYLFGDAEITEE